MASTEDEYRLEKEAKSINDQFDEEIYRKIRVDGGGFHGPFTVTFRSLEPDQVRDIINAGLVALGQERIDWTIQ